MKLVYVIGLALPVIVAVVYAQLSIPVLQGEVVDVKVIKPTVADPTMKIVVAVKNNGSSNLEVGGSVKAKFFLRNGSSFEKTYVLTSVRQLQPGAVNEVNATIHFRLVAAESDVAVQSITGDVHVLFRGPLAMNTVSVKLPEQALTG